MERIEDRVERLERLAEHFIEEMKDFKVWVVRFLSDYRREVDRQIREYKEQTDRKIAEYRAETDRQIREYREETNRRIEEYREETNRKIEEYKEEHKRELRESNKRWGEIANKLGTIVEDIIFPALRPVIEKYFGCEVQRLATRLIYRKKSEGIYEEFDAVAECENMVFLVEVKSTPREKHIEEFKEKAKRFLEYFPEYANKKLILIMGSLAFDDGFVKLLSQAGIYAMAYREWEYMDILNFEEVQNA